MDYMLPIIIMVSILSFFILVFVIGEIGEKNIELLWKIVRVEFIIILLINLFIWIIVSKNLGTIKNLEFAVVIGEIILFIFSGVRWKYYEKKTLKIEEKVLYITIIDGNGKGTGKAGLAGLLAIFSIIGLFITIVNVCGFIF
ncbi:hypothetical protein SAMN02745163_02948 [Clostridium cavendishii DSM 21758]|uniref:Uncharacterized protein n=1 Tax=Clostridium cavendishii DSM 21758 TaxID=1121302 RepID=A0A1M6NLY9_9CLOT|nr:hypothetical protein [Clostridium cavendishii]SHJ96720.1 hypothetical protein SAMN02745163_02948 [Clostridium cavendishii DSM 21758]